MLKSLLSLGYVIISVVAGESGDIPLGEESIAHLLCN